MITPRKGFSEERSFGKRTLDFVRNNWWKPIPIVNVFQHNKRKGGEINPFYLLYSIPFAGWISTGIFTGNWTPKQYTNDFEKARIEKIEKQKYEHKIDSTYNVIVNENVDDTTFAKYLKEYVPFSEKEKVVKQNKLEKSLE